MKSAVPFLLAIAVVIGVASYLILGHQPPAQYGHALLGESDRADLIVHGRDVFFDANGDKTAQKSEKFVGGKNQFQVISADGTTRYQLTKATVELAPESVSENLPQTVKLEANIHAVNQPDRVQYQQIGQVTVLPTAQETGWAHFDRAMVFQFIDENLTVPATGGPSIELRVALVTPAGAATPSDGNNQSANGSGGGRRLAQAVPGTIVPTATIRFPSATSDQPIVKQYDLDQFC